MALALNIFADSSGPELTLEDITPAATPQGHATTATDVEPQPFAMVRASDLDGVAEAADFVEDLLTEGGASLIYGPSNCGKSFWVLDLAACIATGRPFRDDLEVDQGAVVYVALEGSYGIRNRIEAMKRSGLLEEDSPLFLIFDPVSLLQVGHAPRLAANVKQAADLSDLPCRLVILDTLSRAMSGGDENGSTDMSTAVAAMDDVRNLTGAAVGLVHHGGKDLARGARGHSSLRAAVDTEIEITRPEGETISTARITKQRDLEPRGPMPFSLEQVVLGTNRRGKDITTCIVRHEDEMMAPTPSKPGRKRKADPEDLLKFLPAMTVTEWREAAMAKLDISASTFDNRKSELAKAGKFHHDTDTGAYSCDGITIEHEHPKITQK